MSNKTMPSRAGPAEELYGETLGRLCRHTRRRPRVSGTLTALSEALGGALGPVLVAPGLDIPASTEK